MSPSTRWSHLLFRFACFSSCLSRYRHRHRALPPSRDPEPEIFQSLRNSHITSSSRWVPPRPRPPLLADPIVGFLVLGLASTTVLEVRSEREEAPGPAVGPKSLVPEESLYSLGTREKDPVSPFHFLEHTLAL